MNKTELTIYVKEKVFGITLPMEHCWGLFAIMDLFRGMMMQTFGCQEKTMTDFWIIAKRTRTR